MEQMYRSGDCSQGAGGNAGNVEQKAQRKVQMIPMRWQTERL